MTSPIPPCPVCGVVPTYGRWNLITPVCNHASKEQISFWHQYWQENCDLLLGRALSERGIHTLSELESRLAPDPRVAVLEKKLAKLTNKLVMVEQESDQRLSAIIGYSDQLLAMKEKYEPETPQVG